MRALTTSSDPVEVREIPTIRPRDLRGLDNTGRFAPFEDYILPVVFKRRASDPDETTDGESPAPESKRVKQRRR